MILYERAIDRRHTLCHGGTRAVSRDQTIVEPLKTTIAVRPHHAYAGPVSPRTPQVEVRCAEGA
jgi:hypothetical protein